MANRFPLIIDTSDSNKIKEIPNGDNLNLLGCGIINAASVATTGAITCASITVNSRSLNEVAFTGNYSDLNNTPILFSGSYNDLTNKPSIATLTTQLQDVSSTLPTTGQALIYNGITARYEPTNIQTVFDIGDFNIEELNNVIVAGDLTNKYLKYYSGAWRPTTIQYNDINNTPTALSQFVNDRNYLSASDLEGSGATINLSIKGSVFGDDSTLLVDGLTSKIVGDIESTTGSISDLSSTIFRTKFVNALDSSGVNISANGFNNLVVLETSVELQNVPVNIQDDLNVTGTINGNTQGYHTGDMTGSVFAENSTLLVDAINGKIVGPIETTNLGIGASNSIREFDVTGTKTVLIDSTSTYIEATGIIEQVSVGNARLRSSGGTATLDGSTGVTIASNSAVQINSTSVNISSVINLTALNAEPASPVAGMLALANGSGWNPAGSGKATLVIYLGGAWQTIVSAP